MAQQDIIIGDSGTVAKDKINGNFDELYAIELKCEWYEEITSGTAGTLTPPTGATILLNEWADGVDALASKSAGAGDLPTFETPVTSTGTPITATLAANGDWTLSGTPSSYPVCIIYVYKVAAVSFDDTKSLVTTTIEPDVVVIDYANPVSVTTTATLTSAAVGRHHVCTGTTADYTVDLPTTGLTSGDLISVEMSAALTKLVTIDAIAGQLIDGVQTLVMREGEKVDLKWDGANWQRIVMVHAPFNMSATSSAKQTGLISGAAEDMIYGSEKWDVGDFYDNTTGEATIRRAGKYQITFTTTSFASASQTRVLSTIFVNGAQVYVAEDLSVILTANTGRTSTGSTELDLAVGDVVNIVALTTTASGTWELRGDSDAQARLVIRECPE